MCDDVCVLVFLQGALHVMLLPPVLSVYLHDWPIMKKVLPLIVKVQSQYFPVMYFESWN